MLRILLSFILLVHGLIHLMGFVKAFKYTEVNQLSQNISKPIGLLWLITTCLFTIAVIILLLNKDWWWMTASAAVVLSQLLIIVAWNDAKYGTVANAIILAPSIIAYGVWSFNTMARNELQSFLPSAISENRILTKEMISGLPPVVQKWLERSNVIGKETAQIVHLKQRGEMRSAPDGKWMAVEAEQWYRVDHPGFIWLAEVAAGPGIYLTGIDKYQNGNGSMVITFLSLFPVADSKGKEIDQGTMLRYLAEIVWFPSAALSKYIRWEQTGPETAIATMTNGGISASGIFKFDGNGDVVSFNAKRYYDGKGGATLEDWLIQIEPNSVKEFEGIKIATRSTVTWKLREGDFTWYKVEIKDIQYNKVAN